MLNEINKIDNIGDIFVFMDVDFNNSGFKQNLKAAELDRKRRKEEKEEKKEEKNQFSLLTLFLQRALLPFTQQTQLKNHMIIQMQKMGFLLIIC